MPIYEYYCVECGTTQEAYRRIDDRHLVMLCDLGHETELAASVPALSIWDADRGFPNAVKTGPGKFPTKAAYEKHLKDNHIGETKTDGKIYRPHGNTVVRSIR